MIRVCVVPAHSSYSDNRWGDVEMLEHECVNCGKGVYHPNTLKEAFSCPRCKTSLGFTPAKVASHFKERVEYHFMSATRFNF